LINDDVSLSFSTPSPFSVLSLAVSCPSPPSRLESRRVAAASGREMLTWIHTAQEPAMTGYLMATTECVQGIRLPGFGAVCLRPDCNQWSPSLSYRRQYIAVRQRSRRPLPYVLPLLPQGSPRHPPPPAGRRSLPVPTNSRQRFSVVVYYLPVLIRTAWRPNGWRADVN
jgi:hypothetical protein